MTTQIQQQLSLKQRTWHFSPPIVLKVLPEVSLSDVVIILSWDVSLPSLQMSTLVTHPSLRLVDDLVVGMTHRLRFGMTFSMILSRKLNISSTSSLVSLLSSVLFSSSLLSFLVITGLKLLSFSLVRF